MSDDGDWRDKKGSKDWEEVDTCSDGVDNDRDGAVDIQDASCKGGNSEFADTFNSGQTKDPDREFDRSTGGTEEIDDICKDPRAVKQYQEDTDQGWTTVNENTGGTGVEGVLYDPVKSSSSNANYRWTSSGTTCYYKNFDGGSDVSGSNYPKIFDCTNKELSGERASICNNRLTQSFHNRYYNELPTAEYFVPKENIPAGPNMFATSSGLDQTKFQTLHEAETKYMVKTSSNPHAKSVFKNPHAKSVFKPLGITGLSGDNSYDPKNWQDHWVTSNAGSASTSDVTSKPGSVVKSDVFAGGFAGRCPVGERFQYLEQKDRWQCSGQLEFSHKAVVPNVEVEDTSGKETVGLILNTDFKTELVEAWGRRYDNTITDISIDVTCYAGGEDGKSDSMDTDALYFEKTVPVPDNPGPAMSITGDIQMENHDTYSCNWHFNVDDEDPSTPGQVGGPGGIAADGYDKINLREFSELVGSTEDVSAGSKSFAPDSQSDKDGVTLRTDSGADDINDLGRLDEKWGQ